MKRNFRFWISLSLAVLNLQASPVWAGDPILGSTATQQQPTTTAQNNSSNPSTSPSGSQASGIMPAGPLSLAEVRTASITLSAAEKKRLTNLKSLKFEGSQPDVGGASVKLVLTAQNTPKTIKFTYIENSCTETGCRPTGRKGSLWIHVREDAGSEPQSISFDMSDDGDNRNFEVGYGTPIEMHLGKPELTLTSILESTLKPTQNFNADGTLMYEKAVSGKTFEFESSDHSALITNVDGSQSFYSNVEINPTPPASGNKLIYSTFDNRSGKTIRVYGHLDKTLNADKSYTLYLDPNIALLFDAKDVLTDMKVGTKLFSKVLADTKTKLAALNLPEDPTTPETLQKAENLLRAARTQIVSMLEKTKEVLPKALAESSVKPFQESSRAMFNEFTMLILKTRSAQTYKIGELNAAMEPLVKALQEAMKEVFDAVGGNSASRGPCFEGCSASQYDNDLKGVTASDIKGLLSNIEILRAESVDPMFYTALYGRSDREIKTSGDHALGEIRKLITRLVKKFKTTDPAIFKSKLLGQANIVRETIKVKSMESFGDLKDFGDGTSIFFGLDPGNSAFVRIIDNTTGAAVKNLWSTPTAAARRTPTLAVSQNNRFVAALFIEDSFAPIATGEMQARQKNSVMLYDKQTDQTQIFKISLNQTDDFDQSVSGIAVDNDGTLLALGEIKKAVREPTPEYQTCDAAASGLSSKCVKPTGRIKGYHTEFHFTKNFIKIITPGGQETGKIEFNETMPQGHPEATTLPLEGIDPAFGPEGPFRSIHIKDQTVSIYGAALSYGSKVAIARFTKTPGSHNEISGLQKNDASEIALDSTMDYPIGLDFIADKNALSIFANGYKYAIIQLGEPGNAHKIISYNDKSETEWGMSWSAYDSKTGRFLLLGRKDSTSWRLNPQIVVHDEKSDTKKVVELTAILNKLGISGDRFSAWGFSIDSAKRTFTLSFNKQITGAEDAHLLASGSLDELYRLLKL